VSTPEQDRHDQLLERRHRVGRRALVVGIAGFAAAMIGSYLAGSRPPTETLDWFGLLMIACYLGTPLAFAAAAANLVASDSVLLRGFLAVLAAGIVFVLVLFFGVMAMVDGGGHIHF